MHIGWLQMKMGLELCASWAIHGPVNGWWMTDEGGGSYFYIISDPGKGSYIMSHIDLTLVFGQV